MLLVRDILELAYFSSGVVAALAALYATAQVRILKRDLSVRIDRGASEKAIEYSDRYLTRFIPLIDIFIEKCEAINFELHDGPVGEFSQRGLSPEQLLQTEPVYLELPWTPAFNELEAIAAAFVSGVADETLGFKIIGRSFVETVKEDYCFVAYSRDGGPNDYFEHIVQLYHLWAPRLSAAELSVARDQLAARLASIKQQPPGKIIGKP